MAPASRYKAFPPWLLRCASALSLQPGQEVFHAGAVPRHIHFVEAGAVRLVRHGRQGEAVVLHDASPGEFLAEASLDSPRYHCTAVVTEPSVVLRAGKADLDQLLAADPLFARQWMAVLAMQLRAARARVERLSLRRAEDRIVHLLLAEGSGPQGDYVVRGSLKDLARQLGLTHESLYRTLARMQKAQLLDRDGPWLRLCDKKALAL